MRFGANSFLQRLSFFGLIGLVVVSLLYLFVLRDMVANYPTDFSFGFIKTILDSREVDLPNLVNFLDKVQYVFFATGILAVLSTLVFHYYWSGKWPEKVHRQFHIHTKYIDCIAPNRINVYIIFVAGISLFLELAIIRLHASYLEIFAYFKNFSLISCFLGLGIGYARAHLKLLATPLVFPLLSIEIILLWLLKYLNVGEVIDNPVTEFVGFGISQASNLLDNGITVSFLVAVFFFNTLCFVPIGQLLSRLMLRKAALHSYGWDLIGSLGEILVFTFLSFLWTSPLIWFGIAALSITYFLRSSAMAMVLTLLSAMAVLSRKSF